MTKKRPFGRTLSDITDERTLTQAEKRLIKACRMGMLAMFGDEPPTSGTDGNRIHADLLRFLILGGDDDNPVHEKGVQVQGAWIEGKVDLENAMVQGDIICWACHFTGDLVLRNAQIASLYLDGSQVQAIKADGLRARGGVFLRKGKQSSFEAHGTVRLLSAQIGGDLACTGGKFLYAGEDSKPSEAVALHCDRLTTGGAVFLRDGFEAHGTVRLLGAQIGGSLECDGGKFLYASGRSLNCQAMVVKGGLLFRDGTEVAGTLGLTAVRVGSLVDARDCWPRQGELILDGFTYDRFAGDTAPVTDEARADWLMRQKPEFLAAEFCPQPWKQAIKVLRDMGHDTEARKLAILFEQQRRKAGVFSGFAGVLHDLYGAMAGYGHRPLRLLQWVFGVLVICSLIYRDARDAGVMAPTNPLVFDNPAYIDCRPRIGSPTNWTNSSTCNGPNKYTTFQPLFYSLDLILPLVDLQQDKDWAPMVTRPSTTDPKGPAEDFPLGHFIRAVMWFEILFGWVASLMFVAILSGLIKKGDEE